MYFQFLRKYIITYYWLLFPNLVFAQQAIPSNPIVQSFTSEDYDAGSENWGIDQDGRGIIYIANYDGLLEFDGEGWKTYKVPNRTIVRSLLITDERIYVGAQGDFGHFSPTENGDLEFKSLKGSLPKQYRNFDDVWKIHRSPKDEFFFTTSTHIFRRNSDQSSWDVFLPTSNRFEFSFYVDGIFYVYEIEQGLFKLEEDRLKKIIDHEDWKKANVTGMISIDNKLLIATEKKGFIVEENNQFVPWEADINRIVRPNFTKESRLQLFSLLQLSDGNLAIGTREDGIYLVDKRGRIIQHINRRHGLPDNHVRSLKEDEQYNLWVGLNNGVAYIQRNSNFSLLNTNPDMLSTSSSSARWKDKMYVGTSNGAFVIDLSENTSSIQTREFKKVEGSDGEVRNLQVIGDELFMAHHRGAFMIKQNRTAQIDQGQTGYWTFASIPGHPNYLLAGTYEGLSLLKRKQTAKANEATWELYKELDYPMDNDFKESSRFLAFDERGYYWVSHIYKGAFRIKLTDQLDHLDEVQLYDQSKGFNSNLFVNVFNINDQILFGTTNGIYEYSEKQDTIMHSGFYDEFFQKENPDEYDYVKKWFLRMEEIFGLLSMIP